MSNSVLCHVDANGQPAALAAEGDLLVVGNYVWDTIGLAWVKMTQPGGGGGGGGDASAANQLTEIARLEAIRDRLPAALVGGRLSVDVGATVGLTDAQLRASAIPTDPSDRDARVLGRVKLWDGTDVALVSAAGALHVDGSGVTQPVSGPLTDAQLRATPVPVSGPLTDAQLRATAVPVDVNDRAAREVGRVRLWDGTDEATLLPVRTQPATTEKSLPAIILPGRLPIYGCTTTTITPAITIGVKELLAIWAASGDAKDKYIMSLVVSILVTTASTAGRSALRVSTITSAPTGGTELAKVDISGAGASGMTNTMQVKTGGGAIGSTFIRELTQWTTTTAGRHRVPLFEARRPEDAILLRGGVSSGISIDIEREVAHTALVDLITVYARWMEL